MKISYQRLIEVGYTVGKMSANLPGKLTVQTSDPNMRRRPDPHDGVEICYKIRVGSTLIGERTELTYGTIQLYSGQISDLVSANVNDLVERVTKRVSETDTEGR